jgi:hypothetical protein
MSAEGLRIRAQIIPEVLALPPVEIGKLFKLPNAAVVALTAQLAMSEIGTFDNLSDKAYCFVHVMTVKAICYLNRPFLHSRC